ncbi:unnamed protein product [Pylaiella littoralis]
MDRLKETLFEKTSRERDYTLGVMDVIDKMHINNVFHGDMHSGNIMIDGDNNPLMIDFGKSKTMPSGGYMPRSGVWCMIMYFFIIPF